MEIVVNGKKLEHNPGDTVYYVWFGSTTGQASIRDTLSVGKVEIDEDGIRYFDCDGGELTPELMRNEGLFWSREEAEEWLKNNYSGFVKYRPNEEIYIAIDETVTPLRLKRTDFVSVREGRVIWEFYLPGAELTSTFLVDDLTETFVVDSDNRKNICPIVFKSYNMAKEFYRNNKPT